VSRTHGSPSLYARCSSIVVFGLRKLASLWVVPITTIVLGLMNVVVSNALGGRVVICSWSENGDYSAVSVFDRSSGRLLTSSNLPGHVDTLFSTAGTGSVYIFVRAAFEKGRPDSVFIYTVGSNDVPERIQAFSLSAEGLGDIPFALSPDSTRALCAVPVDHQSPEGGSPDGGTTKLLLLDDQGRLARESEPLHGLPRYVFFDSTVHQFGVVLAKNTQRAVSEVIGPARSDSILIVLYNHTDGSIAGDLVLGGRLLQAGVDGRGVLYCLVTGPSAPGPTSAASRLLIVRGVSQVNDIAFDAEPYSLLTYPEMHGCILVGTGSGRASIMLFDSAKTMEVPFGQEAEAISRLGKKSLQIISRDSLYIISHEATASVCRIKHRWDNLAGVVVSEQEGFGFYFDLSHNRTRVLRIDLTNCTESDAWAVGSETKRARAIIQDGIISGTISLAFAPRVTVDGTEYIVIRLPFVTDFSGLIALGKDSKYLYAVRRATGELTVYNVGTGRLIDNFDIDKAENAEIRFSGDHRYLSVGKTVIDTKFHLKADKLPGFGYASTIVDPLGTRVWILEGNKEVRCLDGITLDEISSQKVKEITPDLYVFN